MLSIGNRTPAFYTPFETQETAADNKTLLPRIDRRAWKYAVDEA
jgi:hypothetical protein